FHVKPEPPVSSGTAEIIRIVEAIKSELRCGICCSTLKDPVITTCNHLFCRSCYTECLKQLKSLTCPMCKQKLSRRSSKEVDIYTNVVSHYLQLAKAFTRDLQPLALKPDDNFLESQAVVVPGSAPSPLRNFQPVHQFAIPSLPTRRRGKRSATESEVPSVKIKHLKLDRIGEEDEEEVAPAVVEVKRERVTPPPPSEETNVPLVIRSRVKEERKSEEPLDPPRRRSTRGKSVANEERKSPPIETNLDIGHIPISLVPYSQSSSDSSVVPATQFSQGEEKEVQTDQVEKLDVSTQSEVKKETLRDEITTFRASHSSSSSLSDLTVLLKIHPELSTIMKENVDEIRRLFFPPEMGDIPMGRMRKSEVLAKCFATPTGYTDDESEVGYTKGSSATTPVERSTTIGYTPNIDRSRTVNGRSTVDERNGKSTVDERNEWIEQPPKRANTDPIGKKKSWIERKKEEKEREEKEEMEESSEEGSVQAERGEEKVEEVAEEKKGKEEGEGVWEDENDSDKEEIIGETPEESEKNEEEKEKEKEEADKLPSEIETMPMNDPFAFDGAIPPPVSPLRMRRTSSSKSVRENAEKVSSLPKSLATPRDESDDSFNESFVFDTVQEKEKDKEKTEPLGEINLETKQRTPSRRSPRKTPSKKESLPDSFDDECESTDGMVISFCGVTSRHTEELVGEFRVLFPSIHIETQAERGATYLVVLDSVDRHIRASSLQLASAHASKCTVISKEWMQKCIEKRKIIDSSSYGIVSVLRGEAPAWQRAKVEAPLLAGYTLLLPNNYADSKALPRDRLSALILKCGGKVVDRPWKLPKVDEEEEARSPVEAGSPLHNVHSMRSFILFSPGSADSDSAMRFERDTSVPVFTADWLIDSLSQYSVIITDTDRYRVALQSPY
ncbi:hypothetical protein PENTCL1PPCAC_11755, partial [Pristionchus entomophagus]